MPGQSSQVAAGWVPPSGGVLRLGTLQIKPGLPVNPPERGLSAHRNRMLVQLLLQKDGGAQTSTVPQGGGNDAESPLPWEGFGLRIYLKQILHRCEAGGAGWGSSKEEFFVFK